VDRIGIKPGMQVVGASTADTVPRLVTVHDAAKYLSISVSTLYGWVFQRRIPFVKVGRALRFDRTDLDNFINQNRTGSRH